MALCRLCLPSVMVRQLPPVLLLHCLKLSAEFGRLGPRLFELFLAESNLLTRLLDLLCVVFGGAFQLAVEMDICHLLHPHLRPQVVHLGLKLHEEGLLLSRRFILPLLIPRLLFRLHLRLCHAVRRLRLELCDECCGSLALRLVPVQSLDLIVEMGDSVSHGVCLCRFQREKFLRSLVFGLHGFELRSKADGLCVLRLRLGLRLCAHVLVPDELHVCGLPVVCCFLEVRNLFGMFLEE
mmetsp:Transcript_2711/g.6475  ORF Transcript_2711/g.6475 Transcript_2711/m.6475 type:complete len:238 (-) Transcript_2711:757-1470(-)